MLDNTLIAPLELHLVQCWRMIVNLGHARRRSSHSMPSTRRIRPGGTQHTAPIIFTPLTRNRLVSHFILFPTPLGHTPTSEGTRPRTTSKARGLSLIVHLLKTHFATDPEPSPRKLFTAPGRIPVCDTSSCHPVSQDLEALPLDSPTRTPQTQWRTHASSHQPRRMPHRSRHRHPTMATHPPPPPPPPPPPGTTTLLPAERSSGSTTPTPRAASTRRAGGVGRAWRRRRPSSAY